MDEKVMERVFAYHVGLDYIHIYDNKDHDHSGNPVAVVSNAEDAKRIADALNEYSGVFCGA